MSGVNQISFGGVPAASFTIRDDGTILATVATGASGDVVATNYAGSYFLPGFTFLPAPVAAAPVISSFSPPSGPVNTPVTINGSYFSSDVAGNQVFFGSAKATVTGATATTITCMVPAGATLQPITVLNSVSGLSGQSRLPFNLTFPHAAKFNDQSFTDAYSLFYDQYKNTSVNNVVAKDIDGDGKPDIMTNINHQGHDSIKVLRNITDGSNILFEPGVTLPYDSVYSLGNALALEDLDGDGKPEILRACGHELPFVLLRHNTSTPGHISFEKDMYLWPRFGTSISLTAADMDNDGRNDLVVAAYESREIEVARNTGSPGHLAFATIARFATGDYPPVQVAVADLDGDGKKDMVTCNNNYDELDKCFISYFLNTSSPGAIAFAPHLDIVAPGYASGGQYISLVDFDNDGKTDIVLLTTFGTTFYRNTSTPGHISFGPAVTKTFDIFNTPMGGRALCIENLSGDELPDIAFGNYYVTGVALARNTSRPGSISIDTVAIETPQNQDNRLYAFPMASADFNLDGKPDLAVTGLGDHALVVYKNETGKPVMPVGLQRFTAVRVKNMVQLRWLTATEQNAAFFNILRSRDGVHFLQVGKVAAHGNSTVVNSYGYDDDIDTVAATVLYYRLQQVDENGQLHYSAVAKIDNQRSELSLVATPNPVKDQLKVSLRHYTGRATFTVTDMLGHRVCQVNGGETLVINTGSLAPGLYIVSVIVNGKVLKQKFTKGG